MRPTSGTPCRKTSTAPISLSGNPLFKEFADVWRYEDYWRQFAETPTNRPRSYRSTPIATSTPSAAPPWPTLSPATALSARSASTATTSCSGPSATPPAATAPTSGSCGPDGSLGRSLELYAGHAEIPCGTWAAFKLSRYLMGFTGEARFGDWIETTPLQRHRRRACRPSRTARPIYYGDYRISGGMKQHLLARMAVLLRHLHPEHGRLPQHHLLPRRGRPLRQSLRSLGGDVGAGRPERHACARKPAIPKRRRPT